MIIGEKMCSVSYIDHIRITIILNINLFPLNFSRRIDHYGALFTKKKSTLKKSLQMLQRRRKLSAEKKYFTKINLHKQINYTIQKRIQNPLKYLRLILLAKTKYFRKNAPINMITDYIASQCISQKIRDSCFYFSGMTEFRKYC